MPKLEYVIDKSTAAPRWSDAEKARIDITVAFPHIGEGPVRYTASKSDPGWAHSEEIFALAEAGEFGAVADYTPPEEPVPFDVSRAQFAREMRKRGLFSQADAVAFVSGTKIPVALQAIIDGMATEDKRDDAVLLILGAARIERDHPMTHMLAAGLGWAKSDMDDFFRVAVKL